MYVITTVPRKDRKVKSRDYNRIGNSECIGYVLSGLSEEFAVSDSIVVQSLFFFWF